MEKSYSFSRIGPDIYGSTHPQNLLSEIKERAEFLYELLDRHVISIDPFSKDCLLLEWIWQTFAHDDYNYVLTSQASYPTNRNVRFEELPYTDKGSTIELEYG